MALILRSQEIGPPAPIPRLNDYNGAMFGIGHWEMLLLGLLCGGGSFVLLAVGFAVFLIARQTQADPSSTTCPQCGKPVTKSAAFCHYCGNKM